MISKRLVVCPCKAIASVKGDLVVDLVSKFVTPALSGSEISSDVEEYLRLMEIAVQLEPPPYFQASYGESYRRHVCNPYWVIQSLVSNAVKEGEGSRDIAKIADMCEMVSLTSDLVIHLKDEARHCRMYLALIQLVFPDCLPKDAHAEIASRFPPVSYEACPESRKTLFHMLDYLIQINLGEVRTRIHQKLLEPVLESYCPDENRNALCKTLCKLAGDECCHIKYTASRIGSLAREFDQAVVEELFCRRFVEFNRYTDKELGSQKYGLPAAPLIRDR